MHNGVYRCALLATIKREYALYQEGKVKSTRQTGRYQYDR